MDQRSLGRGPNARLSIERDVQEHHVSGCPKGDAVRGLDHDPAAARDDGRILGAALVKPSASIARKAGSPSSAKISDIGLPASRSISVVQIHEGDPQPARQLSTDDGLAGARHADEVDDHRSVST